MAWQKRKFIRHKILKLIEVVTEWKPLGHVVFTERQPLHYRRDARPVMDHGLQVLDPVRACGRQRNERTITGNRVHPSAIDEQLYFITCLS